MGLISYTGKKINRTIEVLINPFSFIPAGEDSAQIRRELITNAEKRLYLVAGEANPRTYDRGIALLLANKLNTNERFQAHIMFHKATDWDAAIEALKRENPHMLRLISRNWFGDRLQVYWARERPVYRFMVADNSTLIEKVQEQESPRDIFVQRYSPAFALELIELFNSMVFEDHTSNRISPNSNAASLPYRQDLDAAYSLITP